MRGQEDVVNALREAFARDPIISAEHVRISLLGPNSLVLQGEVQTLEAKEEAGALAQQIAPSCSIDNSLIVSSNRLPSDAELENRAREVLVAANLPRSVGVYVRGGVAYLRGHAENLDQRHQASQVVSRVPGLRAVHGEHLLIGPPPETVPEFLNPADERTIVNQIEAKLGADMTPPRADEIAVSVQNRTAFLRGFVKTAKERHQAELLARSVPGVSHVRNLLVAQDGSFGYDEAMEAAIRHRLGADHVSPPDVKVFVWEDTAYLFGNVDRPEQIRLAEAIARERSEIHHVFSSLVVTERHPPSAKGPGGAVKKLRNRGIS